MDKPGHSNDYMAQHAELLIASYHHWTGKELVQQSASLQERYQALFEASYGIVSHNTDENPVFNYGNRTVLELFEMQWSEFIHLPSRKSAETVNRDERDRLMARVTREGYIDDYSGVRISSTGQRFMIKDAVVWNIIDDAGIYRGQAAVFFSWFLL